MTGNADEQALMRRLGWRLMPVLVLMFLAAFIDRQNISFAKLQMVSDLQISEAAFAFGASLFFVGYVIFEIPSALALQRYGARRWLGLLMFGCGIVTLALAFTASADMLCALRLLLGAIEAGIYPGVVYYLSTWFPDPYRIRMLGFFTLGSSLGNMVGGPVNGALLDFHGAFGLAGWQWVFVGGGLLGLVLTFIVVACLPSSPQTAPFLDEKDRALLADMHRRVPVRAVAADTNPWAVLWDPVVIGFGLIYILLVTSYYGLTYWMPTLVRDFGVSATANGFLNAVPWAIAAVALIVVPPMLGSDRSIFRFVAGITLLGFVCFLSSVMLTDNTLRFVALAIGGPCIAVLNPCFWTFPPRYFSGKRAAASIAAINAVGNIGGFFAPNLAPWVQQHTGSVEGPMLVPAFCLVVLCGLSSWLWLRLPRRSAT
ncbi:MAG: MFS transporter [Bradyrhizobium sp.]